MLRSVPDETQKHVDDFRTGIGRMLPKCAGDFLGALCECRNNLLFAGELLSGKFVGCIVGFLAPRPIGDVVVPECHVPEDFGEGLYLRTRSVIEFVRGHRLCQGSQLLVYRFPLAGDCIGYGFSFRCHLSTSKRFCNLRFPFSPSCSPVVWFYEEAVLGKIAVEERATRMRPNEIPARPSRQPLAHGGGWSVTDVVCDAGPCDPGYEEQFSQACVAIVASGTFQYRSSAGRELMTPGSLLLGNAGQSFECGHEHSVGDRCISFSYDAQCVERIVEEVGVAGCRTVLPSLRVPPIRELSGVVSRARFLVTRNQPTRSLSVASSFGRAVPGSKADGPREENSAGVSAAEWEAVGIELAGSAFAFAVGRMPRFNSPAAEARVSRVVRMIENKLDLNLSLSVLAREARLSRFHFLRVFRQLTALTPHQYIMRARLRGAATRLLIDDAQVVDIALDSGFRDVSNFNHAFQFEFGVSPTSYRLRSL